MNFKLLGIHFVNDKFGVDFEFFDYLWCLTLSTLRGGENSPPPYENPLPFFCKWANFFRLLMTFQVETSNICWLSKIFDLW